MSGALAGFSNAMLGQVRALKEFLFARMYRHPRVMGPMGRAQILVAELFGALAMQPELLPADWAAQCGMGGDPATRRVVRDYIAGMTDNYALTEYGRVIGPEISLGEKAGG
jgi:dGTPase